MALNSFQQQLHSSEVLSYNQQCSKPHVAVSSCCSAGTCYNGECEGLHLSVDEREQHAQWLAPEHQQVIIAAGQSVEPIF